MKWLLILFFTSLLTTQAQQSSTQSISLICDEFYGVDDFENLYYSTNNVLYKKSPTDRMEFYDLQLGDIASVDIINPLKILVFYRDMQTIVFLDNRLNEQLRLNLNTLQPQRFIEHARLAGERRLWLYNMDMSRLELYDYVNNRLINSTTPISNPVVKMQCDYNFCHLITSNSIISFNTYASETSRISAEVQFPVAYNFELLVYKNSNGWKWYRFDKEFRFSESELKQPISKEYVPESLYIKGNKLYIYNRNRLIVDTINLKK